MPIHSMRARSRAPLGRVGMFVGALWLAGAGCSSSPEGPSDEVAASATSLTTRAEYSLTEWQARTTAICNEFEPQQDAVVDQLGVPETPEDVVALVNALTPVVNDYVAALNRVRVPDERRDDVLRTYELNTANNDWAATARDAAVNRNQAGYEFAVGKIEAQSTELRALLVDLGVPACAGE